MRLTKCCNPIGLSVEDRAEALEIPGVDSSLRLLVLSIADVHGIAEVNITHG